MEEIKSYYAIIPASIRYDETLPANAKLLYGEITALSNEKGFCWATNEYFAELYQTSEKTVKRWIKALEQNGHISIEIDKIRYEDGTVKTKRTIILRGDKNVLNRGDKNVLNRGDKNVLNRGDKNVLNRGDKNVPQNNTINNNTIINIIKKESKKESYDEILSAVSDDSLRDLYYEFIKMRKLIKSPMTNRALIMLVKKVNELETSVDGQKTLLETAIINNWKSVYPLKQENKKPQKDNSKYALDDMAAIERQKRLEKIRRGQGNE